MRCVSYCSECGSTKIEFIDGTHFEKCFCENCGKETSVQEKYVLTPYERTRNNDSTRYSNAYAYDVMFVRNAELCPYWFDETEEVVSIRIGEQIGVVE